MPGWRGLCESRRPMQQRENGWRVCLFWLGQESSQSRVQSVVFSLVCLHRVCCVLCFSSLHFLWVRWEFIVFVCLSCSRLEDCPRADSAAARLHTRTTQREGDLAKPVAHHNCIRRQHLSRVDPASRKLKGVTLLLLLESRMASYHQRVAML